MTPKAKQARDGIARWIQACDLGPGERLPPERTLARELGLNHRTIRRGLDQLVAEGLIVKRPRSGNFIQDPSKSLACKQVALVFPQYILSATWRQPQVGLVLSAVNEVLDPARFNVSTVSYGLVQFGADMERVVRVRRLEGVLLWAQHQVAVEELAWLRDAGVQVVMLTRHTHLMGLGLPTFHVDRSVALAQLLEGLCERGHRRIAVVNYQLRASGDTLEAVLESFRTSERRRPVDINSFSLPNPAGVPDYRPLHAWFDLMQKDSSPPTALIVPDEYVAGEVFRCCYERHIRIPEQLSLAACHDATPDAHPIPLTSPDSVWATQETVRLAARHLAERLEGEPARSVETRLAGEVHWKASVAVCSTDKQNARKAGELPVMQKT